jgi:hypothetical protein
MLVAALLIAQISAPLLDKMRATTWRSGCPVAIEDLRQLTVPYWNFERKPATGILIVHQDLASEVGAIFEDLYKKKFLIERITPVEEYGGDDDASMAANNTSAFNCRDVTGKPGTFSNHSWGRTIDINPLTNPYVRGDKVYPPAGRAYLDRSKSHSGSILKGGYIVERFKQAGWTWGGDWSDLKDYQHFEKAARQ